ncbi:MAG: aminobenzoate oxygenase, partial [Actinomycetes bacterium]
SQAERDEREEFCVEASYRMRDRFLAEEVWERMGLPGEVSKWVDQSELQRQFRGYLFTRIVPVLKDIGLWGPKIRQAFTDMDVIGYADTDLDAEMAGDERAAEEFDRAHEAHVRSAAAAGAP